LKHFIEKKYTIGLFQLKIIIQMGIVLDIK